ncbi:MAG: SDR family NAD(P)-dependent oxidoreductase [Erythrobacter sp.]
MHVVMTGATSGFGHNTARRLVEAGLDRLTIGAREPADLDEGLERPQVDARELDLEHFSSVRAFADSIGNEPIDALVLNAGIQLAKPERAPNGMEKTFLVNQLSHFLLLDLLRDRLAPGARVILTGSGTHDPAAGTMITPPDHADAERLAWPERDETLPRSRSQAAMRAYSSSKLANIMTARELARREDDLVALSFDPGYVPGTRLSREYPWLVEKAFHNILPLIMPGDRSSSIDNSGRLLAMAIVDRQWDDHSGAYLSVRGEDTLLRIEPSELAQDDEAAAKLWNDCKRLVGQS